MATRSEKLAQSLEVLKNLMEEGRTAIQSKDLTRTHRERLLGAGYLQEVMKGWYISASPEQGGGESASWYVCCNSSLGQHHPPRLAVASGGEAGSGRPFAAAS